MRMNCSLPHWERVSVSRCRCMPQGNSGPFTKCVLRCRTRKLSRTAIVTAKLGLRWWIEFRCGSLSAETYPRINLTDWCKSPRDVRFTACWIRRCRFKQRATIPPLTLPEDQNELISLMLEKRIAHDIPHYLKAIRAISPRVVDVRRCEFTPSPHDQP